jgi:myo-inositol catabolism protein IolC
MSTVTREQFESNRKTAFWVITNQECDGQMSMLMHKVSTGFTTQIYVFETDAIFKCPTFHHDNYTQAVLIVADQMTQEHIEADE